MIGRVIAGGGIGTVGHHFDFSDDLGVTWRLAAIDPLDPSTFVNFIAVGNGTLVAGGSWNSGGPLGATSTDGNVWTALTTDWPSTALLSAAAYDGTGLWVLCGSDAPSLAYGHCVQTSRDLVTFTTQSTPGDFAGFPQTVIYAAGLWLIASAGASPIMTSPDGITWTSQPSPIDTGGQSAQGAAYGAGLYVVGNGFSFRGFSVVTSPDGITWTARSAALDNAGVTAIAWNGSVFVAVGSGGSTNGMTSPDGIAWTGFHSDLDGRGIRALTWDAHAALFCAGDGILFWTSPDGTTWTRRTSPPAHDVGLAAGTLAGFPIITTAEALSPAHVYVDWTRTAGDTVFRYSIRASTDGGLTWILRATSVLPRPGINLVERAATTVTYQVGLNVRNSPYIGPSGWSDPAVVTVPSFDVVDANVPLTAVDGSTSPPTYPLYRYSTGVVTFIGQTESASFSSDFVGPMVSISGKLYYPLEPGHDNGVNGVFLAPSMTPIVLAPGGSAPVAVLDLQGDLLIFTDDGYGRRYKTDGTHITDYNLAYASSAAAYYALTPDNGTIIYNDGLAIRRYGLAAGQLADLMSSAATTALGFHTLYAVGVRPNGDIVLVGVGRASASFLLVRLNSGGTEQSRYFWDQESGGVMFLNPHPTPGGVEWYDPVSDGLWFTVNGQYTGAFDALCYLPATATAGEAKVVADFQFVRALGSTIERIRTARASSSRLYRV